MKNILFENFEQDILIEYNLTPLLNGLTLYNNSTLFGLGIDIYSSPKLEKLLIYFIENSNISSQIKSTITSLVLNKKIIMGYTNPGKFNFLYQKIKSLFGIKATDAILGYYEPFENLVYVILDNSVNIFGNAMVEIDTVVIHELCHMAAYLNNKTSIIEKSFNKLLLPYYTYVIKNSWKSIYNEEVQLDKNFILNLKKTIYKLLKKNEQGYLSINDKIKNAYIIWKEFINSSVINSDKEKTERFVKSLLSVYMFNYEGQNLFEKDKVTIVNNLDNITDIMVEAYKNIGTTKVINVPGQEFLFPSEIIAVSNQYGIQSDIINSLNRL